MLIDLKTEVAAVVAMSWDDFSARHPRLSRVIDQHLLVENAASYLRLDPDYQRALSNARSAGASTDVVIKLIEKYVGVFLEKLV